MDNQSTGELSCLGENGDFFNSIKTKLLMSFGVVILFLILISLSTMLILHEGKKYVEHMQDINTPAGINAVFIANLFQSVEVLRLADRKSLSKSKKDINSYWINMKDYCKEMDKISMFWVDKEHQQEWQRIKKDIYSVIEKEKNILEGIENNKELYQTQDELAKLLPLADIIYKDLFGEFTINSKLGLITARKGEYALYTNKLIHRVVISEILQLFLLFVALCFSVFISIRTANLTWKFLKHAIVFTCKISNGDLSQELELKPKLNEFKTLYKVLTSLRQSLLQGNREIFIGQEQVLDELSNKIQSAHIQILKNLASINEALDAQTKSVDQEQTLWIGETTTAIQQISTTTLQAVEQAKKLGELAKATQNEGIEGVVHFKSTVDIMKNIQKNMIGISKAILNLSGLTQKIGDINTTVANLAQQSKILALNASIEAAKAGEAGKGFSVVASEVKNLAEQSQNATVQINKILQDIQFATEKTVMVTDAGSRGVEDGLKLSDKAKEIIEKLSRVINDTFLSATNIVNVIEQENEGIDQISRSMEDLVKNFEKTSRRFSSTSGQSKYAVNQLDLIVKKLQQSIKDFKEVLGKKYASRSKSETTIN